MPDMNKGGTWPAMKEQWRVMSFYERFEQVIALTLSAVIAVIIVAVLLPIYDLTNSIG